MSDGREPRDFGPEPEPTPVHESERAAEWAPEPEPDPDPARDPNPTVTHAPEPEPELDPARDPEPTVAYPAEPDFVREPTDANAPEPVPELTPQPTAHELAAFEPSPEPEWAPEREPAQAPDWQPESEPVAAPAGAAPSHKIRDAFAMTGLAILAFVVGLLLFNYMLMPRLIHGQSEVRVPDLTNLTLDQAERQVAPQHLQISRAGERFDPAVPSGFILSQDPPQGTPVRGRHRVLVVVSLGEEFSSVPALAGETQRAAGAVIDRIGLQSGGVTRAYFDDVGEGLIVDSDPPAESVLPRGGTVGLLLSAGARPETYVMPDLLGRESSAVRRQLEALGFHVVMAPGSATSGPVLYQDPPAGSRVSLQSPVTLRVMRVIR